MKTRAFTRDERKTMIVSWFAIRIQRGNEQGATMNQIARGLGMKPSSHLSGILWEMFQEKTLDCREVTKPGRWTGREYRLLPGTYQAPKKRTINLSVSGKPAGQLELF